MAEGQFTGRVRYAAPSAEYWFIESAGAEDVYLGIADVDASGLEPPMVGDRLRFDLKEGQSGYRAINVSEG